MEKRRAGWLANSCVMLVSWEIFSFFTASQPSEVFSISYSEMNNSLEVQYHEMRRLDSLPGRSLIDTKEREKRGFVPLWKHRLSQNHKELRRLKKLFLKILMNKDECFFFGLRLRFIFCASPRLNHLISSLKPDSWKKEIFLTRSTFTALGKMSSSFSVFGGRHLLSFSANKGKNTKMPYIQLFCK